MSSNLDRIATVDISLDTPIANNANFDSILIIGAPPVAPKGTVPRIGVYNSLEEVTELGYDATGNDAEPVGVAARVAFSQSPKPHEIYIATIKHDDDPDKDEDIDDIMEEVVKTNGWYCVCPVGLPKADVQAVIQWTETQPKICGYVEDDPDNPIVTAGLYLRSYPVYPKVTPEQAAADVPFENKYGVAVAMAAKAMHFHAGEETWALKSLATITPSVLPATFISKLTASNITYITTVAPKNITMGGKTSGGEWIDVIRFRDWLQNDMQVRVVNLLIVHPKIPYTDPGIALVENQMLASLKDGQKYGGIAPDEFDSDGNKIPGYTTSVPLSVEIPSTKKASRVLEDCKFTARLAGAIHLARISGSLTYENI